MNQQLKTIPQISIEIDGVKTAFSEMRSLSELRVQQRLSLPTLCEITFQDSTENLLADEITSLGAEIKINISEYVEPLFVGQITAVEYVYEPSNIRKARVRGYDKLHLLRKRQSVRAYLQMTLQELIEELVSDFSIEVETSEEGFLHERIIQFRQTDLDLIKELSERSGLYFSLRQNTLHIFTPEGIGESVSLQLGENLFEARAEINADDLCRSVKTTGWNTLRVENFQGVSDVSRNGRNVSAEIKTSAFGESFEHLISDENILDEMEAAALSQAELDRHVSKEVTLWGVAEGDPKINAGTPIEVQGIGAKLDGTYVVSSVNHTIDATKGFVSEFSTALPKPVFRQKNSLATLGIVTALNDPERFGRVRAKLPNYNDVETDWMQVVSVGAGIGKGLLALPDIEDTVLVLFPRGELTQGIILGGLYGMIQTEDWDWGIEENKTERFRFQTSGNQKISLDDVEKTVRIENSDGSFIKMSPEKVSLHSTRDLEIAAPGRAITIKGKTIDFERIEEIEEIEEVEEEITEIESKEVEDADSD
jgi:phage protein D